MISNREHAYLTVVRRSGVKPARQLKAGALVVLCPACPQIEINMDPEWKERPWYLRFLDAIFHAIDGNFQSNQKVKPLDRNDTALTGGASYFADTNDFAKYQKTLGPMEPEVLQRANGLGRCYGNYWGQVAGTLGVSCSRHMFVLPGGGVDLQKGERFVNVDYALASALQRWMGLHMHHCIHWDEQIATLRKAVRGFPSLTNLIFPTTLLGVGKFHLPAHIAACRYKFSFNYLPGSGRGDGEAQERIWSTLNALAASTKEMMSGYQHDRINDHHGDMNFRRTVGLHDCSNAQETQGGVGDAVEDTERSMQAETLKAWKEEEVDWKMKVVNIENHKTLHNPYEPTPKAAGK
ncbi:hypothetical protein OF83DRAFT_1166459 [Amylostereum chailletii]|nr:hypothetical protein OF83DRAFT_1166459 [Amylostereum chailletii]